MAFSGIKSILKSIASGYQTLHLEYPVEMLPRYGFGKPPHALLYQIINGQREAYKHHLLQVLTHKSALAGIRDSSVEKNPILPAWNNGFLPGLDMVMLYTFLADMKPATYLEIGSGNSTKVAAKAKADHHLQTRFVSIDPAPRAGIDTLVDEVIRKPFETTDLSAFKNLTPGDIVFVDNSHRVFPNSDATVFFMEVLPFLAKGVIVHLHDIYLPEDYPVEVCERFYSEQYVLAAFLMANPERYRTIMPAWFVSCDPALSQILEPLWQAEGMPTVEKHGASFWIEIQ